MRLAVISDIHANLHALQAVWQDIEAQRPDVVYCLGDLVGYGAFPNEVVEFIRDRSIPAVMGNYDEGVGFDMDDCGCVYREPDEERLGRQSLYWSRENTRADLKAYLRGMPMQIRLEEGRPKMLLVHGSPRKINEYLYEDRPRATFERIAKLAGTEILFFGHTHLPYHKSVAGTLFVNTGTVGKPRDGDVRAGYALVDLGRRIQVSYRRVAYDVRAAAEAVRRSGLPEHFADLLQTGGTAQLPNVGATEASFEGWR
jgi:putative phosphoesterase